MDFYEILQALSVPNRDNGRVFTDPRRLERIDALVRDTKYRRINRNGLFYLYAARPLEEISTPILISSHVDCADEITECFSREAGDGKMLGTYDNAVTNAVAVFLMREKNLPDNVIFAFTGDEEEDSGGAADLALFLKQNDASPAFTVVLDVTHEGWDEGAYFSVENNFWDDKQEEIVVRILSGLFKNWKFVPSEDYEIPAAIDEFLAPHLISQKAALCDESWEYDEWDLPCFSFCLPTKGEMHGNDGILFRKNACEVYRTVLSVVAFALATEL